MTELLTSRSRRLTALRCPRARYWLDEAFGTGFEPIKVAIPLATGGATHAGLASLMKDALEGLVPDVQGAVDIALDHFKAQCADRHLDLEALEQESFVFNEQLALTEALVRLAGTRVIQRLLELYEVLEVERLDCAPLWHDLQDDFPNASADFKPRMRVMFRSIPDALVRSRADGDLYVISWKTTSGYDQQRDQDARTDMQGLSEGWALEARLAKDWASVKREEDSSRWSMEYWKMLRAHDQPPKIRGVQMIYLVKGPRPKDKDGARRQNTPLIKGLRKLDPTGLLAPEFATERYYTCAEPHPFRWAKGGTCPGGANHKRGDEWVGMNAWETDGGVKAWMELLQRGGAGGEGIAALDSAWVMPVPHFRTSASVKSWERQTRAAEARHARDLMLIREYEAGLREHPEDDALWTAWNSRLDECFPQATEKCGDWFHRRCPAWELCHGAPHVAQDPVGSRLYQLKSQYQPSEETVNG